MDSIPAQSFNLIAALRELGKEVVSVEWLCSLLTLEQRKALLQLDFERELKKLEEQ